ncbi:MAG: FxLYD domain-containing protein [Thermoplasmata archaeon]
MGEQQRVRRVVSLWVAVLLVFIAIAATAVALVTTGVSIQKLSLFETSFEDTDFGLTELELEFEGKNEIEVELVLTNADSTPHAAEVTVQILDAGGDVIQRETQSTGPVSAGGDWEGKFIFVASDLVDLFDNVFVVVDQA